MKKVLVSLLASAAVAGLTAFGVVKACTPKLVADGNTVTVDGSAYRTVNLSQNEYPDFTYAAESAVDAVVYVKVTIRQQTSTMSDPFFKFFFGDLTSEHHLFDPIGRLPSIERKKEIQSKTLIHHK